MQPFQCMRETTDLVCGRRVGVIFLVQVASQLQEAALAAGHPQVGAARVEDDLERLGWRTKPDLAIILRKSPQLATFLTL